MASKEKLGVLILPIALLIASCLPKQNSPSLLASVGFAAVPGDIRDDIRQSLLSCNTGGGQVRAGQSFKLDCRGGGNPSYTLASADAPVGSDIGQLIVSPSGTVVYLAPPAVERPITVDITVEGNGSEMVRVPVRVGF